MDDITQVRPAAVAGQFYPASPEQLQQQLDEWLEQRCAASQSPVALIVPHAGYLFSGALAAKGFAALGQTPAQIERVVIACPNHRVALHGAAVPSCSVFATPLGQIAVDAQACAALMAGGHVQVSDLAHANEHAIEVQLPFVQQLLPGAALVPLIVGEQTAEETAQLYDLLVRLPATLLVISSDLSHFESYAHACEHDQQTIERICLADNQLRGEDACGCHALNGLTTLVRRKGWRVEPLGYCNSGDVIDDKQRVVGYASFAVYAQ